MRSYSTVFGAGVFGIVLACTSTSTQVVGDDGAEAGAGSGGSPAVFGGAGGRTGTGGAVTPGGGSPSASGAAGKAANGGTPAGAGGSDGGSPPAEEAGSGGQGARETQGGQGGAPDSAPCAPNPCLNDGICSERGSSYVCECVNGESGTHCEVPCNLTDVTIQFEDLGPSTTDKFERNGVEIIGSADLVFSDADAAAPGLGISGGLVDWAVDGSEFVTFRFAKPVQNVSYYVPTTLKNEASNDVWGEARIEAFDAAGTSLGTETATDNGQKNVSVLFDDEPLSKFTVRISDGDGVVFGNVQFSICMSD